jgi:hypothetical protein
MKTVEATARYTTGGYPLEFYSGIRGVSANFNDDADDDEIREELCIRARRKIADEYGRTTPNVKITELTIDRVT